MLITTPAGPQSPIQIGKYEAIRKNKQRMFVEIDYEAFHYNLHVLGQKI